MITRLMETKLFYTAPSKEAFNDMKEKAIAVWGQYDNDYGYVDEKVARIKDIGNIKDNFMYIAAMFDIENNAKLAQLLEPETREEVRKRLVEVDNMMYAELYE